jgi:hypothetical protein
VATKKIGRNEACMCGSGRKYKQCCLNKENGRLLDFSWRQLRQTEGEVFDEHLVPYLFKEIDKDVVNEALLDALDGEKLPEEMDFGDFFNLFFIPWILFNWPGEGQTLAERYQKRYEARLSPLQKRFIQEMLTTYYSFYVITAVSSGESLTVKDVLLETEHIVKERQGSQTMQPGDLVYSRILTLNEQSIFVGMMPWKIPARTIFALNDFRRWVVENFGEPTPTLLREELCRDTIDCFVELMAESFNPSFPQLSNTDGDPFVPNKLYYTTDLDIERLLEKLLPLTEGVETKESLLAEAKYNKQKAITAIQMPWLKKMPRKKEMVLLGEICLKPGTLTIETNSIQRSHRIQKLLKKLLGEEITFTRQVIQNIKKALSKKAISSSKGSSLPPEEIPEEVQQKIIKAHWDKWFKTKIPALDNQTPVAASKSASGRKLLETLLLFYENSSAQHPENIMNADISFLREKLKLNMPL